MCSPPCPPASTVSINHACMGQITVLSRLAGWCQPFRFDSLISQTEPPESLRGVSEVARPVLGGRQTQTQFSWRPLCSSCHSASPPLRLRQANRFPLSQQTQKGKCSKYSCGNVAYRSSGSSEKSSTQGRKNNTVRFSKTLSRVEKVCSNTNKFC